MKLLDNTTKIIKKFCYYNKINEINTDGYKVILIKDDITNKQQLFDVYNEKLNFPDYFGNNWDAFFDCLVNIPGKNLIIHNDLPLINNNKDLKIYIDTLKDILDFETVNLIFFKEKFKNTIEDIFKQCEE